MILPIKKKWFEMILAGEKTEEYREIKPYYDTRFGNLFGSIWVGSELLQGEAVPEEIRKEPEQEICFRNGYSGTSPVITCRCTLSVGTGRPEWGAEPGKLYYILHIKKILEETCIGIGRNDEHLWREEDGRSFGM